MPHYIVRFYEPYSGKTISLSTLNYLFYRRFVNSINTMSPMSKKFYTKKLLTWIDKVSM